MFLRVVHPRHRVFFQLLAATGVRISEAIALEWRHVELDGSRPHIRVRQRIVRGTVGPPKSRRGRRDIPINHALVVALRQLRADTEWPSDDRPVFPSTTGTVLVPGNGWRRVLKPAAEEVGVAWAGFHTFMHTCASTLFARGRNVVQAQRWLGHHSPAFTLSTYVHLLPGDIVEPLRSTRVRTKCKQTPLDATSEPVGLVKIVTVQPLGPQACADRPARRSRGPVTEVECL